MAKARRTFTPDFKVQAVELVTDRGKSVAEVDAGRFPGLYLVVTGAPAFYDGPQESAGSNRWRSG